MTRVAWGPLGPDDGEQYPPVSNKFFDRFAVQGSVPCAFDDNCEAVGVFYAPEGCICKDDKVQALCAQHAFKAEQNGVDLRVICWLDGRAKK